MDLRKETQEAIVAGERALFSLTQARECLQAAKRWGFIDLLGGRFLSSLMKHSRISEARQSLDRARYDLMNFNRELQDISVNLDIDIGDFLTIFDFMDSFVADVIVQSRLAEATRKIDNAILRTDRILTNLKRR